MNSPLTDAQISQYFPGVNIIQYKDLMNYNSFADLCNNPYKACFILYVNNKSNNTVSGHWNLIFLDNNNNLNLFDSYGDFFNDCNLILIGKNRSQYGEGEPLLSNLILRDQSIDKIYYNNKPYQEKNGSQTCGRHAVYRLQNKNLNNEAYHRLMNKQKKKLGVKNYDQLVVNFVK
jgi:hypothetical protein